MIIFDLDGTLADPEHRRHFVDPRRNLTINGDHTGCWNNGWKPDYKSYYETCDQDTPIKPVIYILEYIGEGKEYGSDTPWVDYDGIQIWSGRCESVRNKTEKWLGKHIRHYSDGKITLKMRPIGDNTPDDQLKERWLNEEIAKGNKIEFVFDDRPKVIRMWRRRGIFVFNCCQHDAEF